MTQPLRNSSSPRRVPARQALEAVRPATAQAARDSESAGLEPPVLLKLADFSHLASRRSSRRPAVNLSAMPATLPVPPVDVRSIDVRSVERGANAARAAEEPQVAPPAAERRPTRPTDDTASPRPTPRGRLRVEEPIDEPSDVSTAYLPRTERTSQAKRSSGTQEPLDAYRESTPDVDDTSFSTIEQDVQDEVAQDRVAQDRAARDSKRTEPQPPHEAPEPVAKEPRVPRAGRDASLKTESPRTSTPKTGPLGKPASPPAPPEAAVADSVASADADKPSPKPHEDNEEAAGSFWNRVGSYRPSIPLLLGLVLATIGVAYVYRPQETPPKRRGSLERAEPKRLFGSEFDEQRPKPMTAREGRASESSSKSAEEPADGVARQGAARPQDADLQLELPMNAPERSTAKSDVPASIASERSREDGSKSDGPNPNKFATRPAPTEHFDSTPPPPMPGDAPLEADASGSVEEEDDGPPPDISGRSYPVTDPANFFYRPQPAETQTPDAREASRPTSGGPR